MARTSKTMLNKTGKRGHPCLVAQLRENASSFSPIDYDISYVIIADIFSLCFFCLCALDDIFSLCYAEVCFCFLI